MKNLQKKTLLERQDKTILLLVSIFIGIFLIGNVSATTWETSSLGVTFTSHRTVTFMSGERFQWTGITNYTLTNFTVDSRMTATQCYLTDGANADYGNLLQRGIITNSVCNISYNLINLGEYRILVDNNGGNYDEWYQTTGFSYPIVAGNVTWHSGVAVGYGEFVSFEAVINLTVANYLSSDQIYPQFSNYWDNNGTNYSGNPGNFNVTVTNTNGTVILNFGGNNYSLQQTIQEIPIYSMFQSHQ